MTRPSSAVPFGRRIGAIVSVALVLRLAWALAVPVVPVSDGTLYDAFARSIASGRGYAFPAGNLTAYWPVGTSAVYAVVYRLFGPTLLAVALFQVAVGAGIVFLAWRLAARFAGGRAAAVTGWLLAAWPLLIEFTTVMASELIFTFLVLVALNVWTERRLPRLPKAVLWGVSIAAATYVRPIAWPLLLLFPLAGGLLDRSWRAAAVTALVSVATAAILFAPWIERNQRVLGRFVLVAANGGVNLWMGNNPKSDGGYMALPDDAPENEADRDRALGAEAVRFIVANPGRYAALCLRRTLATFGLETIGVAWNEAGLTQRYGARVLAPIKGVSTLYWWAVLVVGGAGVALAWRRRQAVAFWPLLLAGAFFTAVPILTVSQDRYHFPVDPFLAIFAGLAIAGLRVGAPRAAAPGR